MRSPRDWALESERHPQLPRGADERVAGYGVMGQPFASGHVLGLRRWTASSVGDRFTSIWHREPDGTWHFYESARPEFACSRWFGHGVQESTVVDFAVASSTLGVGRVGMTGLTANGLPFDANPLRIWRVVDARATINGEDAGPPAPLRDQARLGDFWIPQQGIFAMGRVFVSPGVRTPGDKGTS